MLIAVNVYNCKSLLVFLLVSLNLWDGLYSHVIG